MIEVPPGLAEAQARYEGDAGRAFVAALPGHAAAFLARWGLRRTGRARHGMTALVLPVVREADGTAAALKLQFLNAESAGEATALGAWDGRGAVRLLARAEAPGTGVLLLEAADPARDLSTVPVAGAVEVIAGLLARLTAVPAPAGTRTLADATAAMLSVIGEVPPGFPHAALLRECAAAVREVAGEPGDRLLHWDLHYENVLASRRPAARDPHGGASGGAGGGPWLAIDPKPLAGDPGFELFPALRNRFDPQDVLPRFDVMTGVLGLDRDRARAWTLARVLQEGLWRWADGEPLGDGEAHVGRVLLAR
ncbi:aminoglycoside phosphotransferase family protein [Streptomyces fuscigenes]|uniref:aminoglycoside phosphotransferase family protein n=1 Tax=Streptomyces fuscigenes TaxID=1528880 RepID=UPI001F2C5D2B|nr:aminoglycoside phosphotransferase family protein [Streptomyces fuscigenes]MCF3961989.1 aminoglycoside phosphotransferase family protein [Streptomyces fuscigenes]